MAYDPEKFWKRVDQSAGTDGCWPWLGYVHGHGYGLVCASKNKTILAHRAAWMLHNARSIPPGDHHGTMCVLHSCDNPVCCNPRHLSLGSQVDNIMDAKRKGRIAQGAAHASKRKPEAWVRGGEKRRGSLHFKAMLDESQVAEIRKLVTARAGNYSEIGKRFGVAGYVVGAIARRESWRHVA